jgi:hypothetical protein
MGQTISERLVGVEPGTVRVARLGVSLRRRLWRSRALTAGGMLAGVVHYLGTTP